MEIDKKNRLLKAKSHIIRMPNSKKKAIMVDAYCRLLQYYDELKSESDVYHNLSIDSDFANIYEKYVVSDMQKIIDDVSENAKSLYEFYQKIIDIYKKNNFCSHEYNVYVKTNMPKMANLVYDFFASLGNDVLGIYSNMINNENILISNCCDCAGYALDTIPLDYPCIVVENIPKYLQFYSTLVHEIGHAYQFYLQRNQRNFSSFNPYVEITSLLFEKLFCDYLMKNYAIKDTLYNDLEEHVYFLNDVSISKTLVKLFMDKKIGRVNAYDLSYQCNAKEEDVFREIVNDCGYIMPNKLDLCLDEFHYSVSNIIAMYFHEKLKNNFSTEWKNYKDFICTINYLDMDEVINKYFDIHLVEDNIKKFIKSYRGR